MWKKGGEDEVWGWQTEQEMKGRKKGRREGWGWADGENEGNKREEELRSGVMAGRLPFNLMVLGVASRSLLLHTLTGDKQGAEQKGELIVGQ